MGEKVRDWRQGVESGEVSTNINAVNIVNVVKREDVNVASSA